MDGDRHLDRAPDKFDMIPPFFLIDAKAVLVALERLPSALNFGVGAAARKAAIVLGVMARDPCDVLGVTALKAAFLAVRVTSLTMSFATARPACKSAPAVFTADLTLLAAFETAALTALDPW